MSDNKKFNKSKAFVGCVMSIFGIATAVPASVVAERVTYKCGMACFPISNNKLRSKASRLAGFGVGSAVFDGVFKSVANVGADIVNYNEMVNDATKRYIKAKEEKEALIKELTEKLAEEEKHNVFKDAAKNDISEGKEEK